MKKTKGISLIVLVITIIVMIIIAGAIIISLSNTNVIDQAEQAKDKYNLSQLKEAVNLDRTNALLTRYNTTEGVNISVKELLGLTDSDAMEITSTNTMPANMPAGKYYKLDVTKYGMQSAGTIEDNTIKGAYVINDNYDIYYVVEGTTSEVGKEIDDEKVIEIMEAWFTGSKMEEQAIEELKRELYIEDVESNDYKDILLSFADENDENRFFYFYTIDRLYSMEYKEIDEEVMLVMKYLKKDEHEATYSYASKIEDIRKELQAAFKGKTITEIKNKHNNGTLEQYILDNCNSLKTISVYSNWNNTEDFIEDMTFEHEGHDVDFCEYNTVFFVYDENEIYVKVTIAAGN